MESQDAKYQEETNIRAKIGRWCTIPSGNGIFKRGWVWVELLSRKWRRFDCSGDRGGMAQINMSSLEMTIIAVFVANVYPVNT